MSPASPTAAGAGCWRGWAAMPTIRSTSCSKPALAYERAHPPSLQGFLAWLEHADVEIKRDPETGAADAVRVMTVHGAKGLQAPIVFLPDSCQTPDEKFPLFWPRDEKDREVLLWPPRARFREKVANAERAQRLPAPAAGAHAAAVRGDDAGSRPADRLRLADEEAGGSRTRSHGTS